MKPIGRKIEYRETRDVSQDAILELYRANHWSSAEKPDQLYRALTNSHSLVTAWNGDRLVGLANAISDGHLVVYYPHVSVHPDYHRQGIGRELMARLMQRYEGFHRHTVVADKEAARFFSSCGFERAGRTVPMWIFDGDEH